MKKQTAEKPVLDLEALGVTFEQLVRDVIAINEGMKVLTKSRIKMDTIITLLEHTTKLPRLHIRIVLENLQSIESLFLKPQ